MASEPSGMVLIVCLVPEADPILFDLSMPAHVQHSGQWSFGNFRAIKISGDIQPGARLKMNFFNDDVINFQRTVSNCLSCSRSNSRCGSQSSIAVNCWRVFARSICSTRAVRFALANSIPEFRCGLCGSSSATEWVPNQKRSRHEATRVGIEERLTRIVTIALNE